MESIDYKKTLKHLYQPTAKEVVEVEVPSMNFLMVDGAGDPNTSLEYQQAVEALFSVAYTIKFIVKKGPLALDYGVMPLEGLWWSDDMSTFSVNAKTDWKWTMMIMQPPLVTADMVATAIDAAKKKGVSAANRLRFETFEEGRCAQIMHIGPFSTEGPTVARVHAYIDARGGRRGKHHEIYLSDIRKADPVKWKTIIRQPMNG
ncbi:MAG TPA: GyrI-like domain-containing protein [Bellilinea sp.]|nr:GyrI-like domain-containing protein [Bellilinea sp.]